MPEALLGVPSEWAQFGLAGLIFLLGLVAYSRGWVYSRKSVDDMIAVYKERIADKNEIIVDLKAAIVASEQRNEKLSSHVGQLLEVGKTSNAALTALPGGRIAS